MMRGLWLALAVALPVLAVRADEAKLVTDDVVRAEMKLIRDLTLNAHSLVTHRRMPPADARAFHARVKTAVEKIHAGTTLEDHARDEIVAISNDILAGAAAVAGADPSTTPFDGIIAIDEALALYARRFDHPGWQPLR